MRCLKCPPLPPHTPKCATSLEDGAEGSRAASLGMSQQPAPSWSSELWGCSTQERLQLDLGWILGQGSSLSRRVLGTEMGTELQECLFSTARAAQAGIAGGSGIG